MADFDYSQVIKLAKDLQVAPVVQAAKLSTLVDTYAEKVAAAARAAAPVGATGDLKGSIKVLKTGPLGRLVLTDVYYARFNEYGSGHQPPRPFMEPAASGIEQEFYLNAEAVAGGLDI